MNGQELYKGIYRLDSPSVNGLGNLEDPRDFSFIRVKLNKKFLFFNKYENWRPISFPSDFVLPKDPMGKIRDYAVNPRFLRLEFYANLYEYENIGSPILLLRLRQVDVLKIIKAEEIQYHDKSKFKL